MLFPGCASKSLEDIEAGGGASDQVGDVGAKGEMGIYRMAPKRRVFLARGRGVLLRVTTVGCVLDWCLSDVKSVTDDFEAKKESPRSPAHTETRVACSVRVEAA